LIKKGLSGRSDQLWNWIKSGTRLLQNPSPPGRSVRFDLKNFRASSGRGAVSKAPSFIAKRRICMFSVNW